MTLIIGVILPNGVLLVSDTRGTSSITGEVDSDFRKKILSVTPYVDIAGSGAESNWHASKILRDCLYNTVFLNPARYSKFEVRNEILKLYNGVNNLYQTNHPNGYPIGELLVAELDQATSTFNLLRRCGLEGFTEFNVLSNVKDVEVIGSSSEVQCKVKKEVRLALENVPQEIIHRKGGYIYIVDLCHEIIKKQQDKSIGKNIYISYLTRNEKNGMPQHCLLFIKEDGTEYSCENDGLEEIKCEE
ncbi:hypothetical protein CV717_07285 [Bacillus cereus]|uniref:hypothetical protein n=1 Tax=Bacillus cereus group TaxID=86661 RepID=UPI00016B82E4|nr:MULTISPECIES: hypothetical protein [Bacillus cereus group]AEW55279.1 hypothetical protein bcf_10785 [Bacillus cereus F837/76]KKZ91885.1 hypothetical protein B4086_2115 [Bacillus cereus]PWN74464.1 hypothetical protein CV741_00990 [Bacillus cereus]PWN80190.1 hypothetical protein CV717_07285 [Bacillus cereus]